MGGNSDPNPCKSTCSSPVCQILAQRHQCSTNVSHCYFSELFPRKSLRACWGDITLPPERWSPYNNKTKQYRIKQQSQREEISSEKTGGLTCHLGTLPYLLRWVGPLKAATNWPFSAWLCYSDALYHLKITSLSLKCISPYQLRWKCFLKKQVAVPWLPLPHQPYHGLTFVPGTCTVSHFHYFHTSPTLFSLQVPR